MTRHYVTEVNRYTIIIIIVLCSVQPANPANLPITGWPAPFQWDDQSEYLFEVSFSKFSRHTVLSDTLLLFD